MSATKASSVLILGGTGWLSGRIAQRWVADGAAVTVLARGGRPAPAGSTLVVGDRSTPGAYDAIADRAWDEVVDISSDPDAVSAAVDRLGDRAAHWTYISSVSVYARSDEPGADESAELAAPAAAGEPYDYSRAKAAAEASVRSLGARAAIIRPGLIVGPGDPTDRFGYWSAAFARAGSGPVLAPHSAELAVQVIDVDDLAAFVVDAGQRSWTGIVNAIGPSRALAEVLRSVQTAAGHRGDIVWATPDELVAHDVAHWSGPRSLPLWLPADMPGFATRRGDAYLEAGGVIRPVEETIARVLADERSRGVERPRQAGLSRAEELAVLAALAAEPSAGSPRQPA